MRAHRVHPVINAIPAAAGFERTWTKQVGTLDHERMRIDDLKAHAESAPALAASFSAWNLPM